MTEMLVVIGGCDKKGFFQLSCTEKYNFETKKWTPAATVPGGLKSEFAVCTLQNDIYVSGGHINSKAVWRYMSKLDAWVQVAPLNKGRWRHKMVALQGKIYVVGGFDGNGRVASVECYNSFTNEWHPVAPLLEAVSSAAVTTCHNKLFVIGGAVNDQTNTNQVQCYDPDEDKWIHMAPTPFYLRCLNAVTLDKTIYVVGGLMEKMYSYVPEKNLWSEAVTLPGPLESCGMAICNGKMYILGGRNEQGMGTDKVFSFEPSSGEFTEEPPMPRCLIYHGCVTVTQPLKKNLKL